MPTLKIMKSKSLIFTIIALIIIIISTIIYFQQSPKQDSTGNDFNNFYTPQKEEMCCNDCISNGEHENSKDCLEIIKENSGIRHCYLIMEEHPHTFSQCKQLIKPDNNQSESSGLKICPDEWIDNQQPGDMNEEGRQYYILDGTRREVKEFDTTWVQNNCHLERQVVW
jgi:hypothetical protein